MSKEPYRSHISGRCNLYVVFQVFQADIMNFQISGVPVCHTKRI